MPVAEENREAFGAYVAQLGRHIDAYDGVNPFWKDIYAAVASDKPPTAPDEVVDRLNQAPRAGYRVEPLTPQAFAAKWSKLEWALERFDRFGDQTPLPAGVHVEAVMAAWFLRENGRLEGARRILGKARLPPTYNSLKHAFHGQQIHKAWDGTAVDVLEIGAGGGTLKIVLRAILGERIKSYTIVDLPQMLCLSISAALNFTPDERIAIGPDGAGAAPQVFIPAADAQALSNQPRRFSLCLNTHSFQEMDEAVIAGYFDLIYATAAPQALFFNTNWRQPAMTRLDGSTYDNDPVRYPYRPTDEVIFEGPDPFQNTLRNRFGFKAKTPGRTSIRRIGEAAS